MTFKQKSLHPSAFVRVGRAVCATLCCFGIADGAYTARAQTKVMPHTGEQMSILRLISAGGLRDGRYDAGVDLTMAPGSHTYWKIPGEAGVPPVFAFNGSDNVAQATVSYPVPSRISEEGIEAFGYNNSVVFPVAVTPVDRGKPAVLHVDVTYAVCNRICLPGHSEATLTLTPRGAAVGGGDVAKALAEVPQPLERAPQLSLARIKDATDPTWTVSWSGANAPTDIFPDAPEGFFFSSKKIAPTSWTVVAQQSVTAPKAPTVPVTLVLARPTGSTSVSETFDVGAPAK